MKILKIFGIVVGIHVFALVMIFANPGCSTATKPPPVPSDTVTASTPPPAVSVPNTAAGVYTSAPEPVPVTSAPLTSAPVTFDPNAGAGGSAGAGSTTVRFTPTRPGTPVAGALVAEKVADVTPATTYTIKPGDSLWSIAKKHKLNVADLTAANGMAANANLQPGKKLLIPAKAGMVSVAAAAPASAPAKPAEPVAVRAGTDAVKHTVKSGETLGSIARNYGVRSADIAVANHISDPAKIQAGMELIIPGWKATPGKSGKGAAKPAGANGGKAETKIEAPAPAPTEPASPPPLIPIIRIDENPVTPAPKR